MNRCWMPLDDVSTTALCQRNAGHDGPCGLVADPVRVGSYYMSTPAEPVRHVRPCALVADPVRVGSYFVSTPAEPAKNPAPSIVEIRKSSEMAARHEESWVLMLMMLGANEMAKKAETLGERAYWRLYSFESRDAACALGAEVSFVTDTEVLVALPGTRPEVLFRERDIELMRAAVEKWDREHPSKETST